MIDSTKEPLIRLSEARLHGIAPDQSTINRWTHTGCRGVILESIRIGGWVMTSEAAVARFLDRLNGGGTEPPPVTPAKRIANKPSRTRRLRSKKLTE